MGTEGEEYVSTFGGAFISGKPVVEGSGAGPGTEDMSEVQTLQRQNR